MGEEEEALKKIQQTGDLEAWKAGRDSGAIKTATSGLKRDADSARLGSAGLFAERADAKLPFIDTGFVAEKKPKARVETTADGLWRRGAASARVEVDYRFLGARRD